MAFVELTVNKNRWLWVAGVICSLVFWQAEALSADAGEAVEKVVAPVPMGKIAADKPVSVAAKAPLSRQEARKELQFLLDETLNLATAELHKKATFYPFLAGINSKGQVELVGIPEALSRPDPATTIKALRKAARQLAAKNRFRAVAIYVDFVAERKDTAIKQPGIRVELEHRFPDALSVFIPYFIHGDNRISLMTPQFMPVEPTLFTVKKIKP